MSKLNPAGDGAAAAKPVAFPTGKPAAPTPPSRGAADADLKPQPLYRRVDWLTFIITTLVCFAGYLYTISPDLTLEDCGELAVGSMYAGVPHPPGYPVWTLYTFLFTKLIPISNIAFRVSISSAVAASLSSGLLALLVSRGSSMLLEGIDAFKDIDRRLEQRICFVSGMVGGLLLGFNGYIWSQAVIVEVYTLAVLTLMLVLASLLRWVHSPGQLRYLYGAFFFFGLCFCNHQTLIVAAMGLEVAALAADRRLGRDFFLANSLIYTLVVLGRATGSSGILADNPGVFAIFNIIGIGSLLTTFWFNGEFDAKARQITFWVLGALAVLLFFTYQSAVGAEGDAAATASKAQSEETIRQYHAAVGWSKLCLGALAAFAAALFCAVWPLSYATEKRDRLCSRWLTVVFAGVCFALGAMFYFYMPLASMSNPPMNWGYPRTWEGFIHAFTRGQYEKTSPSVNPWILLQQIQMYAQGCKDEFNWANLLLGLAPVGFFLQMRKRERAWLVGLLAIYLCLGFLLLVLLNPGLDRQGKSLVKVFFTSSHVIIALAIGYGLSLVAGMISTRFSEWRYWLVFGGALALGLNTYEAVTTWDETHLLTARIGPIVSAGISLAFLAVVWFSRERAPLGPILALFCLVPVDSMLSHWAENEQRGHLFGFYFGHDMFKPPYNDKDGKPLYPEMARDAVLYGGTDPGRFCPTYMIFCESFIPPSCRRDPEFDRRDVVLITQNALADNTYLDYIRAHYNRSAEVDPPFFYGMLNDAGSAARGRTNFLAKLAAPLDTYFTDLGARIEKRRRAGTSFFAPDSFTDVAGLQAKLQAAADPLSAFLKSKLGAAASGGAEALASGLNQLIDNGSSLYDDPARFAGVTLSDRMLSFARQNPPTANRIRLNRLLLEAAYPKFIAKSLGGLYPDREILTATPEDAARCYNEYTQDAMRRYQVNQLEPGEVMNQLPDGRVSVSGQVSVMAINGLITKVMFDKNPDHEFYIEESFPLKWMYRHLSPFGIIMKIERQPMDDLSDDQIRRDHEFWSRYSERLIGSWITYDTPVGDICDFAVRTYRLFDLEKFQGDPKFVRDDVAQKSFSKLRNAIGKSIWMWRAQTSQNPVQQAKYMKEAEFALKQAFAYCPFSPEAVFNLAQLLTATGRVDEALRVARTCLELDPDSGAVRGLRDELQRIKDGAAGQPRLDGKVAAQGAGNPVATAFQAAAALLQAGRTNEVLAVFDAALTNKLDYNALLQLAEGYRVIGHLERMGAIIEKMVTAAPENPEAWLNLAVLQASQGRTVEGKSNLNRAFLLNDARRKREPKTPDLRALFKSDPRFEAVRPVLQ